MIAPARLPRFAAPMLDRARRLLVVPLGAPHRCLSWAVVNGGLTRASRVVWRQVLDDELSRDVDPVALLARALEEARLAGAIGLCTARRLDAYQVCESDGVRCVATVGLGNALAAGDPPGALRPVGTVNLLVQLARPLDDGGLAEACALAAEARTAAVLEARVPSRVTGRPATGTGTDCIVVAAPEDGVPERWVGKHTAIGAQLGAAVREATARGVAAWLADLLPGPRR
jgi:adenosylcobinamide amidohydrolase